MDDTRDKVIALEVKVEQMGVELRRLAEGVEQMNSMLDQARGAKWLLGILLFVGGFAANYVPAVLKWAGTVR